MNSLRKWLYRPRRDDKSLLAKFWWVVCVFHICSFHIKPWAQTADHKSRVTIVCEHEDSRSDVWNKDQCSTLATSSWRSCSPAIELLAASKTKGWELAKLLSVNADLWLCKPIIMFHITDFLSVKLLPTAFIKSTSTSRNTRIKKFTYSKMKKITPLSETPWPLTGV